MMMARPSVGLWRTRRRGRVIWALLAFMIISTGLIAGISIYYLIPAMKAYEAAPTARDRNLLEAHALLVMSVVLCILGFSLVLLFRVGRFFFPRGRGPRTRTKYVDVWAEAGKRMPTPPEDESKGQS